jgi:hypothetical protein
MILSEHYVIYQMTDIPVDWCKAKCPYSSKRGINILFSDIFGWIAQHASG